MISILRNLFHPLEAIILVTALYIATAIFPDLKPSLIDFVGNESFISTLMDILIKFFIGTSVVGFSILFLTFLIHLLISLKESTEEVPIVGAIVGLVSDFIELWINHKKWRDTSAAILFDSVLWCISFMAIRFYWDAGKGTGKTEAITFLKYTQDNYAINTWVLCFFLVFAAAIIVNKILEHRFD